jgi:hypothetical protein
MLRKLALILSALALLLSAAATIYLLSAPLYRGFTTQHTESGSVTIETTKTLVEANGWWVAYLLAGMTLASGIPLLAALALPSSQRLVTWVFGLILMAFSILGSLTVGLAYMPSAILLLTAAIVTLFIRRNIALLETDQPRQKPLEGS